MGVTVRQKTNGKGNPWWIFVAHQGQRTSKQVGDKQAAETVASLAELSAGQRITRKALRKNISAKELEKVATDFESVLLGKLLEEMKKTIPESGLFETAISKQVHSLFWFYLAEDMGKKGGMGLWKEVYHQLNETIGPLETRSNVEQLR